MNRYLIFFTIFASSVSYANSPFSMNEFTPQKVSVALSSGLLGSGKSKEYVYAYEINRKVSQLDWEISNSPIVKADLTWQLFPWLSLNANGWTTVSNNSSLMDDYDWLDENDATVLTDWSHHSNTTMTYANQFDLNAHVTFWSGNNYKLGALVGYQKNRLSWNAVGGIYQYSETDEDDNYIPGTALQNKGEFPKNQKGIGYKQVYTMPYLGLSGQYTFNKFELNALFKYSPWVSAKDTDHHYRGDMVSYTTVKNTDYYGVVVDAGYYILPDTKLFTEFTWNKFKEEKGKTMNYLPDSNVAGGGSLSSEFYTVNLGLQYKF